MKGDHKEIVEVLSSVFGYRKFKNNMQEQATIAISEGSEAICISMPPGFGRSLCFQLPAILQKNKVTIILSPKLSFIKKHVNFLRNKQINVEYLSQHICIRKRKAILNDLISDSPKISLLYITLEIALSTYFQNLVQLLKNHGTLYYLVFNEAHCISEWGYDYIAKYKKINFLNKIYKYVPKIAITTTVRNEVIEDICKQLTLKSPKIFKIPVQQLKVYHDVWFLDMLDNPFDHLRQFILKVLDFSDSPIDEIGKSFTIIYCRQESTAELLKNKLNEFGIPTVAYHHRLNKNTQCRLENQWMSDEASVITTTYNYGFIHTKPIKGIVYWTVPETIAKYYRECAQTYRNNNIAHCRIYFSITEYLSVKSGIENHREMITKEHIKTRLNELHKLISYCLLAKCRHKSLSEYFGCIIERCKSNCDVCKDEGSVESRNLNFIRHSKNTENITYNIRCMNEDLRKKETKAFSATKKSEASLKIVSNKSSEKESKEIKLTHKKIGLNNGDRCIVQPHYRLLPSNKQKLSANESHLGSNALSLEKSVQTNTACKVKLTEDKVGAIQTNERTIRPFFTHSCNLNKSLKFSEPVSIKRKRNNPQSSYPKVFQKKDVIQDDTIIEISDNDVTMLDKTVNEQNEQLKKERLTFPDVSPEHMQLKKRMIEHTAAPFIDTRINRPGILANCIKDDTNARVSRGYAVAEHLMTKYNLNKDIITLVPRIKKD